MILKHKESQASKRNVSLMKITQSLQENAQKYLELSVSVTISEDLKDLKLLSNYYLATLDIAQRRMIYGHKSIIFMPQEEPLPFQDFKYPLEKEKQLMESLMVGNKDSAEKVLLHIMDKASEFGVTTINLAMTRLLISLGTTLETLEVIKNTGHGSVETNFSTIMTKYNKLETLDEIKAMLLDIFNIISNVASPNTEDKHQKLLETVVDIIESEYSNQDLSLEMLSEKLNISSSYLGKLFKKYKSYSLVDYLNKIRIEQAKKLITDTDESLSDIMTKTGFTSRSHFYTLFKKAYGIAPGSLRFTDTINKSKL